MGHNQRHKNAALFQHGKVHSVCAITQALGRLQLLLKVSGVGAFVPFVYQNSLVTV